MNFLMMQMKPYRGDGWSAHPNLFIFCEFFKEFPERFRLIGELHAGDDGRNYFSFLYEKPGVPYPGALWKGYISRVWPPEWHYY